MKSILLDIDRASSVFKLLFAFLIDEVCCDEELLDFDEALFEILQGVRLPDDAPAKLRRLFDSVLSEPVDLTELAGQVRDSFDDDRTTILALVAILLRLTVNDGIICKRTRQRLLSFLPVFELSSSELRGLPDELLEILEYATAHRSEAGYEGIIGGVSGYYETLGCSERSSDAELRKAYCSLVKQYHPDSYAAEDVPDDTAVAQQKHFNRVQDAYEAILKIRSL